MLAFAFRVVLLATAAAQSSNSAYYNFVPRTRHDVLMWGQAVSLAPITDGWEYLYDENRSNGRNTWASQTPPSELSFRNREGRTTLQTTQPGQAMSMFFTGEACTLGGTLQVGAGFDGTNPAYWSVFIDGEPARYEFILDEYQDGFIGISGLQSDRFHNATDTQVSDAIGLQNIGNRISFADGNAVQPILTPKGDVAVHQYTFQNGEQEAALALKGDASFEVMVPVNSCYIECDGYVGPDYGVVNFALDPPPPGDVKSAYWSRSTNRAWYTHDTMFSLALNPNLQYKLMVWTEAATAGAGVYLNGSMIYPFSNDEPGPFWINENLATNATNATRSNAEGETPLGQTTSGKVNVGAIAGGVAGGVVFLALLAVLFFLRRSWKSNRETRNIDIDEWEDSGFTNSKESAVTPFLSTPIPHEYAAVSERTPSTCFHSSEANSSSEKVPSGTVYTHIKYSALSEESPAPKTGSVNTGRERPAEPLAVSPEVVQERDWGTLPQELVPPVYNLSWAASRPVVTRDDE
ncbi:hypothetical protein CcaverHIS641_0407880 [Cutaneotrichosporon cavernicola]|nr:hypothetical protein CcaverHIS641_0407880 [Cutaneotrichosporon cavernicola]